MSDFIPSGVLSDLSGVINSAATQAGTIDRTGMAVRCRVSRPSPAHRVPRNPFDRAHWQVTLFTSTGARLASTDVRPGDNISITGTGTYTVIDMQDPTTLGPSMAPLCVYRKDASGRMIGANASVQFQQRGTGELLPPSGTVDVLILPVSAEMQMAAGQQSFAYEVRWNEPYAFTDGQSVSQDDFLLWSGLRSGESEIHYPARDLTAHTATASIRDS